MRRLLLTALAVTALAAAQEHKAPAQNSRDHVINPNPGRAVEHDAAAEHEDPLIFWKWINFGILAGALGYLIGKKAPPFFKGRSADIQREIREATQLKAEAEERAAEMEKRMASLSSEIERLRQQAREQMGHEAERIRHDTEQHIARVQHGAEQEIGSLSKHAIAELKAYSAQLAIDLAAQRIQAEMTPDTQSRLVDRFAHELNARGAQN